MPTSPALNHVDHVWQHAPSKSFARFNTALFNALSNAIASGMTFAPDDLRDMSRANSLHRWLTDGGEGLYAWACGSLRGSDNTRAAIAFETYYGRPAYLWAEETKTPTRLFRGSVLTWQGHIVTVTSFNDKAKSLVACSYKTDPVYTNRERDTVGATEHFAGEYRPIEALKHNTDHTLNVRFGPPVKRADMSAIDRRFTITHAELMAARKAYDATRRKHERAIAAATTLDALEAASQAASAEGQRAFRHFDLDILRAAIKARGKSIRDGMTTTEREAHEENRRERQDDNLRRWMAGEAVTDFFTDKNRLRVKDGFVEVSNGNRVALGTARRTLAFVLQHRKEGWESDAEAHDVETFKLTTVDQRGVTIGCTFIDWAEIDRITPLLNPTA